MENCSPVAVAQIAAKIIGRITGLCGIAQYNVHSCEWLNIASAY